MSPRSAHLGFWFLCLLLLPLPFLSVQVGVVPVARMLLLGSLGVGVWIADSDYISALVSLLLVQGLLWAALLFFATRAVAKRVPQIALAAFAALLILASFFPIYRTPFSASGATSAIFEILN